MFLKKEATAEDLKKSHPLVYEELFNSIKADFEEQLAKLNAELNVYKATEQLKAKNQKISDFAAKLKCVAFSESLIKENPEISIEEAFVKMSENTDTDKNPLEQAQKIFEQTAPASAGNGNKGDLDSQEINTFDQAVSHIVKRDSVSKAQATRTARMEYTNLWEKKYKPN